MVVAVSCNLLCIRTLACVLLLSIFFFPVVPIDENWPTFHFIDFLLPFIAISLVLNFNKLRWKRYDFLLLTFIFIIFISILVNDRYRVLQDYFEIMKIVKFGLIVSFASIAIRYINCKVILNQIFVFLVVFNFIQYFQLFNFDFILSNIYGFEKEVALFGKNTLGQPASKRLIGLLGNPNNNAIIFLFFICIYFKPGWKLSEHWQFYLSILMVFLCQSKIAILAFIVIFIFGSLLTATNIKKAFNFKSIAIILFVISISFLLDLRYFINSMVEAFEFLFLNKHRGGEDALSTSGRWEVWKMLFAMIVEKPLIGHGPYKEYFYSRNLYSENEYILVWWRYGLIGLLSFISLLIYPIVLALRSVKNKYTLPTILFSIVILITALTNNPMLNRDIQALYAILLGAYFSEHLKVQIPPKNLTN